MSTFRIIKAYLLTQVVTLFLCGICLPLGAIDYQVTRTDDPTPNGCDAFDCSLREAILAANASSGLDVVNLNLTQYILTRQGQDDTASAGDLDVLDDLTITGQFTSLVPLAISEINASNLQDRIFDVATGTKFNLTNTLLKNADAGLQDGGAIRLIGAELNLTNTHLILNRADSGGAIFAENSSLQIISSQFIANTAIDTGGGISLLRSQLNLETSKIDENFAEIGGGIAAVIFENNNDQASLRFFNSQITSNYASSVGGGLYLVAGVAVVPNNDQNIEMIQMNITENESEKGGGIYHVSGDLSISLSSISENLAFTSNMITDALGSGIYFGKSSNIESLLVINHSLIFNNESRSTQTMGRAAGIYIENYEAVITNTTFSQNIADSSAAIEFKSGNLELIHNTFALNDSNNGFDLHFYPGTVTTLQNNIINDKCLIFGIAEVNSMGGNIEAPGDTCLLSGGDLYGEIRRDLINPNLQDNGGTTMTHAINSYDSDAIGFAVPSSITDDQRLQNRDSEPDSGAYEVQPGELNVIFRDGFEL